MVVAYLVVLKNDFALSHLGQFVNFCSGITSHVSVHSVAGKVRKLYVGQP